MEKKFKRTLITTALPYANGPVHIGHLAGVYVPADIYARYLRLRGEDVVMVGGSDEHGVPITLRARKEGITPQEVVDRYHTIIKDSLEELGVSFDIYSRTTSKLHHETASEFFRHLYDKGEFTVQTALQPYDEKTGEFLADRYVVGTCPRCHNENAYGDQCEACGSSLNVTDLINPRSALTGEPVKMRETTHWYLPLDKWEGKLREWILEGHKEWKTNVYGQCKSWLDAGLQPRAVSRDLQETEPWKLAKSDMTRTGTILNVALQLCANLAIAFEPFIPFSTGRLAKMLNLGKLSWDMLGQTELVAEGSEIAPAELLFDKIEDAEVQNQVQKLLDTKKANEIAAWKAQPQAETVEFDTFAACDLRVGTVVECEKVPKADKLLRFLIDDGLEKRTIVSGIAKFYKPEDLVGKQVCFIANLAPRKLKGIVSEGMILSAENSDGSIVLLSPSATVAPGAKIG